MAPSKPTPSAITLRLKNRKSTTLLHADPLASFTTIKAELLRALHQTHPSGRLHGSTPIPSDPSEVLLGKSSERKDLTVGFVRLRTEDEGAEDDDDDDEDEEDEGFKKPKKRGAAGKRKGTVGSGVSPDCPKAAGLKDGAVLAYKFRQETGRMKGKGGMLDLDDEDEDDETWDVVLATFNDDAETADEDE